MADGQNQGLDYDQILRDDLVRVFNERDPERRLAALEELYAPDAMLYDPGAVIMGHEAISNLVGSLLADFPPGFEFSPTSIGVGHHGVGTLRWEGRVPGGAVITTGSDVAHIEDGKIKRIYVFIEPER